MKTALVTGAAGFIGRHIWSALEAAGYEVCILPEITWGMDARDYFREAVPRRFDVVIHAAAVVGGRAVIDGDPLAQAVNLELDAAMFAWARRTMPGRVVYLSSSAVYPVLWQHGPGRLREASISPQAVPLQPDALYGWCKLTGERLAVLARAAGVPVTVVRPFSGYGEDQGTDYPFMAIAGRVARREDPLDVWGTGGQVRDWIHVDDICAAIMTMIADGIDGPVNLGTGRGLPVRDLAAMMAAAAGYDPVIRPLTGRPSGVAYRVADVTAMHRIHVPKITVEDGISRALGSLA
jgi:nucleoside-diphosphate-sugar epimerase